MKRVIPLVVSMMLMSACSPNGNMLVAAEQPKAAAEPKAGVSLSDISGHWAESDIKAIVAAGYVDGYPDGSFKPNHTITRAEFITMVAKAAGLKPVPGSDNKEWYAPYVLALVQAGIHQYKEFSSGDWNTPITRLEMARLAVRAADKSLQSPEDSTDAKKFMFLATQKGLITGLAGGELGKEESATRAQSVKIIQRILDVSQGKTLEVDKRAASYAEVELTGSNVQTMWGSRVVELPYKMPLQNTKATVKVHQILILDLKEKDGAFRSMFDGEMKKVNDKPIGDEYLVALKVDLKNETGSPLVYAMFGQLSPSLGTMINIYTMGNKKFILPRIGSKNDYSEGWYLFSISKEIVISAQKEYGFINLLISENNGAEINLGKVK
ncbi:S-layer homology domain-containing protein [Paenibacillus elgii]